MIRPKKRFGQHFLTDKAIAARIVNSLMTTDYSNIVEVGPGKGILTAELLARKNISLFAVEIDNEVAALLLENIPEMKDKLTIGDFLKADLSNFGSEMGIIGNFPYNISSQIFFKVIAGKHLVREVVCMVQKEVAERIISPPGNRTYGILSVLLQTWFDTEYLFTVNPGSFFPRPEVKSGVIRLTRNSRMQLPCMESFFTSVVKVAFNKRRKMLRNSVSGFFDGSVPVGDVYTRRPEQLSAEEFIELATELEGLNKGHFKNISL